MVSHQRPLSLKALSKHTKNLLTKLLTDFFLRGIFALSEKYRKGYVKMNNKPMKFNGSNMHKDAILHLIGQSAEVFREYAVVSDVASWMNVSKPTATKYLNQLWNEGLIYMWKREYKNTFIWMIDLKDEAMRKYTKDEYKPAYQLYAQQVMKVILQ